MMLIGWRRWVLRLFKEFEKRQSERSWQSRQLFVVGGYGKEQMSVDTTKENKLRGRKNLCRIILKGDFF